MEQEYLPEILHPSAPNDQIRISELRRRSDVTVFDRINDQIKDLMKCRNPKIKFDSLDDPRLNPIVETYLDGRHPDEIGSWVFYPWKNYLVHLLGESEFIEVRTNRNKYKITDEEQTTLGTKKIGVIGLSVGQAVALTLAQERIGGELRLADFDDLELSNLNRVRTSTWNLGLNKSVSAAREIAEIDPYIKIRIFPQGLSESNLDVFFLEGGKLDILVEECDGLDIKILARIYAKKHRIPVVMETNDRCMVDIERYDLEPDYPIFHGLVKEEELEEVRTLKTNEEKVPFILKILGISTTSVELRSSMLEIEQSIITWPQLASSVNVGAGILTIAIKNILLGQIKSQGRFYYDFDELESFDFDKSVFQYDKIKSKFILNIQNQNFQPCTLDSTIVNSLIHSLASAPSAANNQPWYWIFSDKIYLFHNENRSRTFWDPSSCAAAISFGCAIKNLEIALAQYQLYGKIEIKTDNLIQPKGPFVSIDLLYDKTIPPDPLNKQIKHRWTNRSNSISSPIDEDEINNIFKPSGKTCVNKSIIITNADKKDVLGNLLGHLERIRLINPYGQQDFVSEIRWDTTESSNRKDGIYIGDIDLTNTELAGLNIFKDSKVVDKIRKLKLGTGFDKIISKGVKNCAAIIFLIIESSDTTSWFETGIELESMWLKATSHNISVHPITTAPILFNPENQKHYSQIELKEINSIMNEIINVIGLKPHEKIGMILKVSRHDINPKPSYRIVDESSFRIVEKL